MELQRLTLHHYGLTTEEDRRVTLSPGNINVIAATVEDVVVNGRPLVNVTVLFSDGGSIDVSINHSDLQMLEEAVGSYGFE